MEDVCNVVMSQDLCKEFVRLYGEAWRRGIAMNKLEGYDDVIRYLYCFCRQSLEVQPQEESGNPFMRLREALRLEIMNEKFPVGTVLEDTWTNVVTGKTQKAPMRVMSYEMINTPDGERLAAILARENVLRETDFYDAQRWLATDYADGCSDELKAAIGTRIVYNDTDATVSKVMKHFLPSADELAVSWRQDSIRDHIYGTQEMYAPVWSYITKGISDLSPARYLAQFCATVKFVGYSDAEIHQINMRRCFTDIKSKLRPYWTRTISPYAGRKAIVIDSDGSPVYSDIYKDTTYYCLPACVIY